MFDSTCFKQLLPYSKRSGDLALIIKIILIGCLIFMVYNLFRALFIMNKNDPNQPSMSKFIGRRVMISAFIVILMLIGIMTGLITPNPTPY
ncbi:DUF2909 domain-containing protein [Pseudocolwellia agarivorans]|uniref:DUF2909 domain-containing protein n=1 Tax=Pseudocolwellia agarivorans TaxID=1911682 RepID=UPI003CCB7CE3